jgi:hypothetical protein
VLDSDQQTDSSHEVTFPKCRNVGRGDDLLKGVATGRHRRHAVDGPRRSLPCFGIRDDQEANQDVAEHLAVGIAEGTAHLEIAVWQ